jgi:hypothetical protein
VTEDEQRGVRLGFNEPKGGQIGSKPIVPSLGCLLEPVQGLAQATDQVRVSKVGEACGLAAEDCLGESVGEEGIFHVELLNGPVTGDSNGKHRANSGRFYNRAESLIVVDSGALSETLKDPTGLIAIKGPVSTELVREDRLAGDNVGALRSGNQLPGHIANQGPVLFLHSRTPMGIGKRNTSGGGDWSPEGEVRQRPCLHRSKRRWGRVARPRPRKMAMKTKMARADGQL